MCLDLLHIFIQQQQQNPLHCLPLPPVVSTCSPGLVHGTLLLELLGEVVESLQTADLGEQPLLVALLHLLQTLPGVGNVLSYNMMI